MFALIITYLLLITTVTDAKSTWASRRSRDAPHPPASVRQFNATEIIHARMDKRAISISQLGCFSDSGSSRTLSSASMTSNTLTPSTCAQWCSDKGYKYSGVEYSKECYCGNTYDASRKLADSKCTYGCSGGGSTTCGGYGSINIYSISGGAVSSSSTTTASKTTTSAVTTTTANSAPSGATSLGCYSDSSSSRTLSAASRTDGANTPAVCYAWCKSQGYLYAGVEYSKECYCGNSVSATRKVDDSKCNYGCGGSSTSPCGGYGTMNIYGPATPPASSSVSATTTTSAAATPTSSIGVVTVVGCFSDPTPHFLNGPSRKDSGNTPDACTKWCGSQGYAYAGVEYSNECYCGNYVNMLRKIDDSQCNYGCSGGGGWPCGGYGKVNVWSIPDCGGIVTTRCNTNGVTPSSSATTSSSAAPTATATGTCNAACDSVVGVQAAPAASGTKYLYAHHMVGNTYSYTSATWADDISLASAAGIDGFALNFGSNDWQLANIDAAYAAAKAKGNFKMFLSFDVTAISCSSSNDATTYANLIIKGAKSSAQALYKNKVLVSTFAGHDCTFGQNNATTGWNYVRQLVTNGGYSIYLIPAIFTDISNFKNMPWFDGEFNWDSAWPTGDAGAKDLTTASDVAYMNALDGRGYMAGVSPAFFTYYSPSSYNKNWIYRSDGWLLARRMEQMVQLRNQLDLAEIISWNDYGESHYIGPIRADQPNSQSWTNGMPHTAWLNLIQYYAPAYKTGTYPTPSSDSMWLWTRPHPKAANPTNPSMSRPTHWETTDDNLYALVILTSPATVTITSGSNTGTWSLAAGVNKISVASAAGVITGKIVRSGSTVKQYTSSGSFSYTTTPTDYNYNYFVAQA